MKVAVFSAKAYDQAALAKAGPQYHWDFLEPRLDQGTAQLAKGAKAVVAFVNDDLSAPVLTALKALGVTMVALRCAGFNNLDLAAADTLGIRVARVPAYSPEAVAEHAVGLMLMLNRHLHKAYNRVREDNFSLDGLLGFNLHGKTVALVGVGAIGLATARILAGFGCKLLASDPKPNPAFTALGGQFMPLDEALAQADVISLHCPLTPDSYHLINARRLGLMKPGLMLINTSRGALLDTQAAINALKTGQLGYLGLDVYEQEGDLFFEDLSNRIIPDDVFQRLLTFPNVVITGHQGYFTQEALSAIASTTVDNLDAFGQNKRSGNELTKA
ncbi:2-hydroxyacid dehydrogenase [Gallaecimonas xiamenensis]|uniref:Fermentative lactate dehydrogenase n=1 Tax=Gallaecimonas xiamenensis 3-C-1 TaxID=745411 RepID=K2J7R2_9GAMM|nr:2-hydroxyacid dehydrogenase [Gallaecimonas xiamenensis]EKE70962.1 fermentative lactate dehydrogenase [Gallaecimonas xiamenensis 3-C-1]